MEVADLLLDEGVLEAVELEQVGDVGPAKRMHVQAGWETQFVNVGPETSTQIRFRDNEALAGGEQVGRMSGQVRERRGGSEIRYSNRKGQHTK